jgi:hypothetical protein
VFDLFSYASLLAVLTFHNEIGSWAEVLKRHDVTVASGHDRTHYSRKRVARYTNPVGPACPATDASRSRPNHKRSSGYPESD